MVVEARKGRAFVVGVIVATFALEILAVVTALPKFGLSHLPRQLIRILIEVWLCAKLYQGRNWARVTVGALAAIATVAAVLFVGAFHSRLSTTSRIVMVSLGMIEAVIAGGLLLAPSVRSHFAPRDSPASPRRHEEP